jgi:hypothetical protein
VGRIYGLLSEPLFRGSSADDNAIRLADPAFNNCNTVRVPHPRDAFVFVAIDPARKQ